MVVKKDLVFSQLIYRRPPPFLPIQGTGCSLGALVAAAVACNPADPFFGVITGRVYLDVLGSFTLPMVILDCFYLYLTNGDFRLPAFVVVPHGVVLNELSSLGLGEKGKKRERTYGDRKVSEFAVR